MGCNDIHIFPDASGNQAVLSAVYVFSSTPSSYLAVLISNTIIALLKNPVNGGLELLGLELLWDSFYKGVPS